MILASGGAKMAFVLILAASALISFPSAQAATLSAPPVLAAQGGASSASANGTAVKLVVFPTPSALLPLANSTGQVFVQLQDANGNPAAAPSPVRVTLDSSRVKVANITKNVVIPQGSTLGTAISSAAFGTGATTITASATGLATGFAQLSVVGPSPSKLSVRVAPGTLASGTGESGPVVVQLQASDGTPTPAPAPVTVRVTSSNTSVGTITDPSFTIPAGTSFGSTSLMAAAPGSTSVTALAQGFSSGNYSATVVPPVRGASGQLSLSLGTPVILPDRGHYATVLVQLQDKSGVPLPAPSNIMVFLSSSNTNVGTIQSSVVVPAGSSFGLASVDSTLAVGATAITASASNFVSSTQTVTSAGPVPFKLALVAGPPLLVASGDSYSTNAVQVQDSSGNPAAAPVDILVSLASSNAAVGDVGQGAVIPSGKSYAFFQITSTTSPGSTQITMSASGYVSGQGTVATTVLPMSGVLTASTQSPLALTAVRVGLNLTSGPYPLGSAAVQWSADSKLVSVVNSTLTTDAGGGAYAFFHLGDSGNVTVGATAQKAGFGLVKTTLKLTVKPQSITILLIPSNTILNTSQSTTISAQIASRGKPLPAVSVSWSSDLGSVSPSVSTTDASGSTTVSFVSPTNGTANVKASVSLAGYGATSQSTQITVNLAGAPNTGGGGGGGGGGVVGQLMGNLVYVLVALVLVVVALLVLRRRRRRGKSKAVAKEKAEGAQEQEEAET